MASQPVSPDDRDEPKKGPRVVDPNSPGEQVATGELVQNLEEGVQEVHDELRKSTISQVILTIFAVLAICYFAKLVLVTIFTSILIAYILEPIVRGLRKVRVPRPAGALIAVLLMLGMLYGLSYFFYQRAVDFTQQLPKITSHLRQVASKYQQHAEQLRQSTQNVLPEAPDDKNAVKVKVEQSTGIRGLVGDSIGNIGEVVLTVAFIPFLVFFMLTGEEHARKATVRLFARPNRVKAYETIGKISEMMKGFIVGNFVIGIFMSIVSGVLFAFLHLQYFYFLGLISGFLSLIPYLGVILALLPPLATGIGTLHGTGILLIFCTILGLHVFSMNVLYPKVIGGRLELNALAVTLALLIWGWIWGAMGLILAVPVMATVKIVCDNVEGLEPFGDWLGESPEHKQQKTAKA
jgi:predicted PurR-regulated permease PerM